jgi:biotin transport system permease protein
MVTVSLFHQGNSWLHRVPAGPKLAALAVAITGILLTSHPLLIAAELLVIVALYPLSRIPVRILWRNTRLLLPFLVLIAGFQLLTANWERATIISGQLLNTVLLAALVTVTTKVSEMLTLFEKIARPLDRIGASSYRTALVLALTIRCVPLVATAWRASAEAAKARGMRGNSWRVIVPVIVRLIRSSEALGDAITARGLDDPQIRRH